MAGVAAVQWGTCQHYLPQVVEGQRSPGTKAALPWEALRENPPRFFQLLAPGGPWLVAPSVTLVLDRPSHDLLLWASRLCASHKDICHWVSGHWIIQGNLISRSLM